MTTTPPPDAGQPDYPLPCPFCGADVFHIDDDDVDWKITCAHCHGVGPWMRTKDEAIAAWNRRAPLAPPREVTEAMVELALNAYHGSLHNWRFMGSPQRQMMRAALSAALNAPARVDENALNELLEPLGEPWEYKGSDVAWQILYRWHKTMQNSNGSAKDAVMSLFLRADGGGLHLLARAINAALSAPARVDESAQRIKLLLLEIEVLEEYRRLAKEASARKDQTIKRLETELREMVERDLPEMRDICGGEVGEITRSPEEQAALERAMGDVDTVHLTQSQQRAMSHAVLRTFKIIDNPNELPMKMLPEGGWLDNIWSSEDREKRVRFYHCIILVRDKAPPGFPLSPTLRFHATGPTPRAAMIAAIEAARECDNESK